MTRPVNASIEAMHEMMVAARIQLTRDAIGEFGFIFSDTVEAFMSRVRTNDPWEDARFRKFIVGRIRAIAIRASKDPAAKPSTTNKGHVVVTSAILHRAAFGVMTTAKATCKMAISRGRIVGLSGTEEGDVCNAFLSEVNT